jgi:hypothetical protein
MMIREATVADVPALVEMGRRMRASTGYAAIVPENPQQMAETAEKLMTGDNGIVLVTEGRGGELTSMIGLVLFTHHISGLMTAGEVFWWSESAGHGLRLFKAGKAWAQAHGAVKLQMVQPVNDVRVGKLYAHLGLQHIESAWEMDVAAA